MKNNKAGGVLRKAREREKEGAMAEKRKIV